MENELLRLGNLPGTKKCIVSGAGYLQNFGLYANPIGLVKQSDAFPIGSPIIVKNFCLYGNDKQIIEPDIHFRRTNHQPSYLTGEVVGFQKITNGRITWYRDEEIPTHFHVKRLIIFVEIVDSLLNMAGYDANAPDKIKLGVLSESEIGSKHAYYLVGRPRAIFAGVYERWFQMSVKVSSLLNATHVINRRRTFFDLYEQHLVFGNWPIDDARFMMYCVDKAIQVTGMGTYRGKTGTRFVGRRLKRLANRRQRYVSVFDNKARLLQYRCCEIANIRRMPTKKVELMYGIR